MLLGGVAVFVLAVTQGARCQRQLPMPKPKPDAPEQAARSAARARWSVAAGGAAIGAFLFILSLGLSAALPKGRQRWRNCLAQAKPPVPGSRIPLMQAKASDAASLEELKQNWPRFRGADGSGVSTADQCARDLGPEDRRGHCLEGRRRRPAASTRRSSGATGSSSPAATRSKREVFCLDGKTGQTLWRQPVANVPGAPAQAAEVPESTGYAASTMATDGRRVYVIFANGDCAAFTLEGKPVWAKSFGALKNPYGHATSLATWQDRLIVQLDQGDSRRQQIQTLRAGRAHRPDRLAAPAQGGQLPGPRPSSSRPPAKRRSSRWPCRVSSPTRRRTARSSGAWNASTARSPPRPCSPAAWCSWPARRRSCWRFALTGRAT